jgi:hypothetical protein
MAYVRYAWALRSYLRETVTPESGREVIRVRLQNREQNFLSLMKRAVYDYPSSPYLPMLQWAGCEYGDLERMVHSDGLEPALRRLCEAGVFLTIEESKGKRQVVRGGRSLPFRTDHLNNPLLVSGIQAGSSGSRSAGTATTLNLDRTAYHAACNAVSFSAHGMRGRPTLLWNPILPSAAGLAILLQLCKMGSPPERWFSPVAAAAIRPSLSKRLATLYVVHAGRLFGSRIPSPEYVSGEEIHVIAECLRDVLKRGQGCVISCSPSSAARLSTVARAAGMDLSGVTFMTSGEPLTPAKDNDIRSAGAGAMNLYAFAEGGVVGLGCAGEKSVCDDVHFMEGSQALIQRRRETSFGGGPVDAFLFTSLFHRTAKVQLNVESGDFGVHETRDCGCELCAAGLRRHLHTIRSFDKLTGEGMTFVGTDLVRIIEEVLPLRFGGASTDYQMVETEDAASQTRVDVVVSPDVGIVDEAELVRVILSELGKGGETNRMMAEVWRQGRVLRVKRETPHLTREASSCPSTSCGRGRTERCTVTWSALSGFEWAILDRESADDRPQTRPDSTGVCRYCGEYCARVFPPRACLL